MEEESTHLPSPLLLAYLGDSVMEVLVREHLVIQHGVNSASCNKAALEFVTAAHQAEAAKRVKEILTEEELELFTRAKNAKSNSAPRNVSLFTYRLATAYEALFGYHALRGENGRNRELFYAGYPHLLNNEQIVNFGKDGE